MIVKCLSFVVLIGSNFKMCSISRNIHSKCRAEFYPGTNNLIKRFLVPDDRVSWLVEFKEYEPVLYTSSHIIGQEWADLELNDPKFKPKWNTVDGSINRQSHIGNYEIVKGVPRNPMGRTGIKGRGILGRWGPNHAADPIVTRWKRNNGSQILIDGKPVLQFVAIQRRDSGEWAIPGGMVDAGEMISSTLKREFMEEAMNYLEGTDSDKIKYENMVRDTFQKGEEVFRGYVDDPRNTDNAWMETVALNFHDEDGSRVGAFPLNAGDDAKGVKWTDISRNLKLYASHSEFISEVAKRRNSYW